MSRLLQIPLLVAATALVTFGQSDTAVLFGNIKDPVGGTLSQAKVKVKNTSTSLSREIITDEKGLFYFTLLPPGNYELSVEADGFKQYHNAKIVLQVAQVSRLDIQMQLGKLAESVDVTETVSPLNTENVAQGTVISQEKLPALPLNGRQFLQLVLLVPGANPGGRA